MGKIIDDTKKIEDLHPPKAPVNVMYQKAMERLTPKIDITEIDIIEKIEKWAKRRTTIRSIMELINDFNALELPAGITRMTPEDMSKGLTQAKIKIKEDAKIAGDVNEIMRGSKSDYRNVMKELKEVLAKRKEVVEHV